MTVRVLSALTLLVAAVSVQAQEPAPAKVRFLEPRTEGVAALAPVDPATRITIQYASQMMFGLMAPPNRMLSTGVAIRTHFKVDDRLVMPTTAARQNLPPGPGGQPREGILAPFAHDNLMIAQSIEVVPSQGRNAEGKRLRDAVLVKYHVENRGDVARRVGVRMRMDAMCGNNDGALFAAPNFPGKILDGIELKGDTLPEYVKILERPNLNDPGMVGHFALRMKGGLIGPDRFVCTGHGVPDQGWDVPARPAGGDSDVALFWEPRLVPPRGSVTFAYGYGVGLATLPEAMGRVRVNLAGSFEPGQMFAIQATVEDPVPGQSLTLELPPGLVRLEGKEIQSVPSPTEHGIQSLVTWKGRVTKLGEFPIRIRSSTGIAVTRTVVVEAGS